MFSLRKALVLATLFLGTFSSPTHNQYEDSPIDWETFQQLLDSVDPLALHNVLHALSPKFKDGVFSKDRSAMEHVHSENPAIASKLVYLAKRQSSNSTITSSAVATPSTPQQSSSAAASSSEAASVSSLLASAVSASTVPPPTTILVAPTTPVSATPVATTNGAIVFSTKGGGLVTLTSSAVPVSFTRTTSTHLVTSTMANGQVQTSTELIIVNAPVTATASAATAAASATGSPGLQNGASKGQVAGVLGAMALGAGAMMII